MKNLFLVSGGGHCHSCIDVIEQTREFQIKGIFDLDKKPGELVLGYPILGNDSAIGKFISSENFFLVTLGQIKSANGRLAIFENLNRLRAQIATVISPRAYVSPHARIGVGTIVMHDALVNANAQVGVNCIVNSKALIEHDARVGDHCHISTAAVVNGGCAVGNETFIGSNAVLKQAVRVAPRAIVAAGSFFHG